MSTEKTTNSASSEVNEPKRNTEESLRLQAEHLNAILGLKVGDQGHISIMMGTGGACSLVEYAVGAKGESRVTTFPGKLACHWALFGFAMCASRRAE